MTTPAYVLHNYWRSGASYRVRIALALKGLPYTYRAVNLIAPDGGAHHSAEYRELNPQAQVPTLELPDGRRLTQSLPIIEYLDEQHPTPPLLPTDSYRRARTRAIAEAINSSLQPLQNLSTTRAITALGHDAGTWVRSFLEPGLRALEVLLSDVAGTCCVGDAPTLADCVLVPQLYAARRFAVDLENTPRLLAIDAHLHANYSAFTAAHPDRQPDAKPDAKPSA